MAEFFEGLITIIKCTIELVLALLDLGFQSKHWRIAFGALCGILLGLVAAVHIDACFGLTILFVCIILGIVWNHYDDRSQD